MDLDIAELRSIVAIAKHGSFSEAASVLHISQPALSRRIALAEAKLGAPLFDRLSRGVRPTESCSALLVFAEAAIANVEKAVQAVHDIQERRSQEITVGFPDVLFERRITDVFQQIMAERPAMCFEFRSFVHSDQLSSAVAEGQVDLGIRYREDADPRLNSLVVAEDETLVVCAPDHPMAKAINIDRDILRQQKWISYPIPSTRNPGSSHDVMENYDLDIEHTMAVTSVEARLTLIEAGFGAGLVSRSAVQQRISEGRLVALETSASAVLPIHLIYKRDDKRVKLIEQICRLLRAHLNTSAVGAPE